MSACIPAVILAAGGSRRLGRPKQLLELDGETLVDRAVRLAGECGASPAIVVLGGHRDRIEARATLDGAAKIFNPQWEQGIASSIQAGLIAAGRLAPSLDGALILPCDQLRLSAAHLRGLLRAFAAPAGPRIAASSYAGALGVPAVFPRSAFPALLALEGDMGARALLARPPCPVVAIPLAGGEVDIDLPADLGLLG